MLAVTRRSTSSRWTRRIARLLVENKPFKGSQNVFSDFDKSNRHQNVEVTFKAAFDEDDEE